jgi:phage recombination protein Bet
MSENAIQTRPATLVERTAERFGVDAGKLMQTMKMTCFKQPPGRNGAPPIDVTNEQMMALLIVAEKYGLNPFTKEIYAFADKGGIAPLVSIDGWLRLGNDRPELDGIEFEEGPRGSVQVYKTEYDERTRKKVQVEAQAFGPEWVKATVYRKDRAHPLAVTEYLSECWMDTDPWRKSPTRMLRHRATIQALRIAFGFSGIADEDDGIRIMQSREVADAQPTQAARIKDRVLAAARHTPEAEPADVMEEPAVDPKTAAKVKVVDALIDGTTNPADAVAYLVGAGFTKGEADRIVEAALAGE